MTKARRVNGKPVGKVQHDLAARSTDAAVRRAVVEARQDILNFLRRRLGNQDEAEDVLQLFSVRALEKASDLRNVRSVRGWLGRILANAIVDHHRRTGRRKRREITVDKADIESLAIESDREVDEAVCNCLHKLLPTLKAEYAEVIWRADLLGEPRDRIAASLGVTLNNVTVRLYRGRQALRKRLEEMCVTCPIHGFLYCRCDDKTRTGRPTKAAVV